MRWLLGIVGVILIAGGCSSGSSGSGTGGATSGGMSASASTGTSTNPGACDADADCTDPKQHCQHKDGLCGKGVKGICVSRSSACSEACFYGAAPRLCGCDGKVFTPTDNNATEYSKDASLCSVGTFPCGALQCKKYVEYCDAEQAQPSGGAPQPACVPTPEACFGGLVYCACLKSIYSTPTSVACNGDLEGTVTLSCAVAPSSGSSCGPDGG